MSESFNIVSIAELSAAEVLKVINDAFGRNETEAWYRWKHHEGPWGESTGVAAVDRDGPIGVRLLLPWRFRRDHDTVLGHRATEAATVPRAQGRGVFTALNKWMMEAVPTALIFSTPNLKSRGGYLKLGWDEIACVPHRWELAMRPRRGAVIPSEPADVWHTDWDVDALRWRADARCGHRYRSEVSGDSLLVYRLFSRRGIRVAAPTGVAGDPEQATHLWRRMLDRTGARLLLIPSSQLGPQPSRRLAWHRGQSLILGWAPSTSPLAAVHGDPLDRVPWSAADLEGVI